MEITDLPNAEYALLPEPRPHRFADREPSDVCYIGLARDGERRPCRCQPCRDSHAAATRERQQAQRTGLWIDGRRAIRTQTFLAELAELAERVPELYALLRKHGHMPLVVRVQPDSVTDEPMPPQPADGEAVATQARQTAPAEGNWGRPGEPGRDRGTQPRRRAAAPRPAGGRQKRLRPRGLDQRDSISHELGIPLAEASTALSEIWGSHLTMGAGRPRLVTRGA